jgi:hypothetical protein
MLHFNLKYDNWKKKIPEYYILIEGEILLDCIGAPVEKVF